MNSSDSPRAAWRTLLWIYLPFYLLSLAYLAEVAGVTNALLWFAGGAYQAVLAWLTVRLTQPLLPEKPEPLRSKALLWGQLATLALMIVLTGWRSPRTPLWSGMVAWLSRLGEALLPVMWFGGPGNALANPVQYFIIPLLLLLFLGARLKELSFAKGHRVWRVSALWLPVPMLVAGVFLASGVLNAQAVGRGIISNAFQNGFFEEFLFRGALQTRLRCLLPAPWALALQALIFGLWHLRSNTQAMNGDLLAGLAICLASQTVIGFVFGLVFERTRNLAAPSIAHVFTNVMGQMLG